MQEPTKEEKQSIRFLSIEALRLLDPRNIICITHQSSGVSQAMDFWVFQDGKLAHFHTSRTSDHVNYLFARNFLHKNHDLYDEIYLSSGLFIYVKKIIEPEIDTESGRLTFKIAEQLFDGPILPHDAASSLKYELGRREIYTSDLCSIDLLDVKIHSRKIIRKYFGQLGLKYYKRSKLCGNRTILNLSMQRLGQSRNRIDIYPFIAEINQIPITQLIEPKFTDEILKLETENQQARNLEKFIYDRYYYSLLNDSETQLLAAIIQMLTDSVEQLEEQFTPDFWTDAVDHVRFLQQKFYTVSEEEQAMNASAYNMYRARYILEKLGSRAVKHFLNDFFAIPKLSKNACNFSFRLSQLLGEDIDKLFLCSEKRELLTDSPFGEIFRYPIVVRPPKSQLMSILHRIEHTTPEQLTEDNLLAIAYFFANFWYISSEKNKVQALTPTDALYAATRIIRTAPHFSSASQYAIYYAGDIINSIQNHLPERQLDFQKYIHDLFWPFVQSNVDFVKNYHRTEFSNDTQEAITDNALDWLLYLPDLNKINPALYQYLVELGKLEATAAIRNNSYDVYQAARCVYLRTLPAKERLEKLKEGSEEILQLYYSDSVLLSDTKAILPYLFSERCRLESKNELLEDLASSHKNAKIYEYAAKYTADHLPALMRNFQTENYPSGQLWALRIFYAFCDGAKDVENIEALEYFASKLSTALIGSGRPHEFDSYIAKINLAFSNALKNIENYSFVSSRTHFVGTN